MKRFIATCAAIVCLFAFICQGTDWDTPWTAETEIPEPAPRADPPVPWPDYPERVQNESEPEEPYEPAITPLGTLEDGEYIWESLSRYSPNDIITAGIIGYFYRESRLRSDAVAAWPQHNIGREEDICTAFAAEVDAGMEDGSSRDYFIHEVSKRYGGYGLGQWSAVEYLEQLYDFAVEFLLAVKSFFLKMHLCYPPLYQPRRVLPCGVFCA